jgi:hypothetical protein
VIVTHHADLLRLFQNIVNPLGRTVQDDVRLRRVLDLLEKRPGMETSPISHVPSICIRETSVVPQLIVLKVNGRILLTLKFIADAKQSCLNVPTPT